MCIYNYIYTHTHTRARGRHTRSCARAHRYNNHTWKRLGGDFPPDSASSKSFRASTTKGVIWWLSCHNQASSLRVQGSSSEAVRGWYCDKQKVCYRACMEDRGTHTHVRTHECAQTRPAHSRTHEYKHTHLEQVKSQLELRRIPLRPAAPTRLHQPNMPHYACVSLTCVQTGAAWRPL